jgi:uncharacterized coiled-coil DUF342 family protein
MKRIFIIALMALLAAPAAAQQAPQDDPKITTYRNLLSEANDRVVSLNATAVGLQEQIKALTAERDKLRAEIDALKAKDPPK